MKLKSVTLHQVSIPLVTPFETSFMRETEKDCYLVEAVFDTPQGEITGWGESVAMISPLYSSEYVAAGIDVLNLEQTNIRLSLQSRLTKTKTSRVTALALFGRTVI